MPEGSEFCIYRLLKIGIKPNQNETIILNGFNNLRESNADMGFKTRWNRPLVTKLNLSKVWTQYFMGDFLILIGHVWSFKKLCFAPRALIIDQYGPKKRLNLNKVWTWMIWLYPDWSCLTSQELTTQHQALSHTLAYGHKI